MSSFTAIGVDPGLAETGFAVVEVIEKKGLPRALDTISTCPGDSTPKRLQTIFVDFGRILRQWNVQLLVIEDVYVMPKYPKAAMQLGAVRGVLKVAAAMEEVQVMELRPTEVKVALTGNGRASKQQVERTVRKLCALSDEIKPDHASDALAMAMVGLSRCGMIRW